VKKTPFNTVRILKKTASEKQAFYLTNKLRFHASAKF